MNLDKILSRIEAMEFLSTAQKKRAKRIAKKGCAAGILLPILRAINNYHEQLARIEEIQGLGDNLTITVTRGDK